MNMEMGMDGVMLVLLASPEQNVGIVIFWAFDVWAN